MERAGLFIFLCALTLIPRNIAAFYSDDGPVLSLDPTDFEKKVPGEGVWLVEFYAPWCGHCQSLAPVWKEAAAALNGVIHVGAVDADVHKSLAGEFGVQGFPTIKLIAAGKNGKRRVIDYKGGRTAKDIVEWGSSQAKKIVLSRLGLSAGGSESGKRSSAPPSSEGLYGPTSAVVSLTDSNFHSEVQGEDLWMVEFYAPWCGHCKNLKSDWEQLAAEVAGKAKIGAVDCTAHQSTCQEFGVQGYPTIKYFGPDKDSPSDYAGGRDSSSLASFILGEWRKSQPPPEVRALSIATFSQAKELLDQHVFEEHCSGNEDKAAQKLCFIAFLPDILDSKAAGRRKYIEVLTKLAEKYSERPFSYLWCQGGAQPALEKAVNVGGYGYPAFIALNPKEAKYGALRESFDLEHAAEFIERLRQGFERVSSIEGALAELGTTSPWDGGEGQALEEDEFSLEDLMKEEL